MEDASSVGGGSSAAMPSITPLNPFEQLSVATGTAPAPPAVTVASMESPTIASRASDDSSSIQPTSPQRSVIVEQQLSSDSSPRSSSRSNGGTTSGGLSPTTPDILAQTSSLTMPAINTNTTVPSGYPSFTLESTVSAPQPLVRTGSNTSSSNPAASIHANNSMSSQPQQQHSNFQHPHFQQQQQEQQHRLTFDDDETTEPSSAGNTEDSRSHHVRTKDHNSSNQNSSNPANNIVTRMIDGTRKRINIKKAESELEDDAKDFAEGSALISGYLRKLGRNGKWQTRWFETDGLCLSYFKSQKRTKLLATLDLEKVGSIEMVEDPKECSFSIQVLGRPYHLRADNRASCKDWVITLNRVKEARMQQGNVKLINATGMENATAPPIDLLDNTPDVVPRVVVRANRQRTRAVDESVEWDKLIQLDHATGTGQGGHQEVETSLRRTVIGNAVLGRWSKRRSSMSQLSSKLAKWARSIHRFGCTEIETQGPVQLDRHVHPPGHDDKMGRSSASSRRSGAPHATLSARSGSEQTASTGVGAGGGDEGLSGWIGKEQTHSSSSSSGVVVGGGSGTCIAPVSMLDAPTALPLLAINDPTTGKPNPAMRSLSSSSDDARMIS